MTCRCCLADCRKVQSAPGFDRRRPTQTGRPYILGNSSRLHIRKWRFRPKGYIAQMAPKKKKKFSFLTYPRLANRRNWLGYQVTVFSPYGLYPAGTFHVPDGVFHADGEIVFSVVRGGSWERLDPNLPYSELRGLSPDQLRLVAALMLCEKREGARLMFYPEQDLDLRIDARRIRLDRADVVQEIRSLVIDERANSKSKDSRCRPSFAPQRPYDLWPAKEFALDRLNRFWTALSPLSYVLARGLHALMKADMLSRHPEFWEEATIACYIALDASFSHIKGLLAREGVLNASAHDAARWVHAHFNASFGLPEPESDDKYFGEMYEQRVMTLHPSSRYGESPVAPMMREDYMFLRRDLREIFAYLVTGEHGQDYHDDVTAHARLNPT